MPKLHATILYLILFGLAAEVVILSIQKNKQQKIIQELLSSPGPTAPFPSALQVGDRLASQIALTAVDGSREELRFGPQMPHRLVLLFNTRCPACAETLPTWEFLTTRLEDMAQSVMVTNDALEEVASYLEQNGLGPQGVDHGAYRLDGDYQELFGVAFVPHTLLVDPLGTVLGIWPGPLNSDDTRRLGNLLNRPQGFATSNATSALPTKGAPTPPSTRVEAPRATNNRSR